MGQALLQEYNEIDWNKLRAENPGEYTAMQLEFQQRQAQLETIMAAVANENGQLSQTQMQEQEQQRMAYLQDQFNQVVSENPKWQDPDKMRADLTEMSQFMMQTYGYLEGEVAQVSDHRHFKLIQDAMAYRAGKTIADKKVANAPRFVKGGKSGKTMDKVTQLALNARRATGAHKRDLQAAAVAELLSGNG
jgi:hypothetical protein